MGNCIGINIKKNKENIIIYDQEKIEPKEIYGDNNSCLSLKDDNNLSILEYSLNNKSNNFYNEN